jgi:hypothetical protein
MFLKLSPSQLLLRLYVRMTLITHSRGSLDHTKWRKGKTTEDDQPKIAARSPSSPLSGSWEPYKDKFADHPLPSGKL